MILSLNFFISFTLLFGQISNLLAVCDLLGNLLLILGMPLRHDWPLISFDEKLFDHDPGGGSGWATFWVVIDEAALRAVGFGLHIQLLGDLFDESLDILLTDAVDGDLSLA